MRLTYRYRIDPTAPQAVFLNGERKEAASLYNAAREERIGAWKLCRQSIHYYHQANQLKSDARRWLSHSGKLLLLPGCFAPGR
jgi:hypothetical protein